MRLPVLASSATVQLANKLSPSLSPSVEVESRRSEAGEDEAAIRVDAQAAPGALAPPRDFQESPSQVSCPSSPRTGHGPETPDLLARAYVERSDIPQRGRAYQPLPSQETPRMIVSFQTAGARMSVHS